MVTASSKSPFSFTYGRFVASAFVILVHGALLKQVMLSVPVIESTYATCISSATHEPSERHAFDRVQSACCVHAVHLLFLHTGVVPPQAMVIPSRHCTQVLLAVSHTGKAMVVQL